MARYDKYDPVISGFRAPLAANLTLNSPSAVNGVVGSAGIGPVGVSLDANGRVVVGGGGQTSIRGVLVKNMPMGAIAGAAQLAPANMPVGALAGDIVDIMTNGEIVDLAGLAAGTDYYADATTGALTTAAGTGGVNPYVGHTVEATRLVVRFGQK